MLRSLPALITSSHSPPPLHTLQALFSRRARVQRHRAFVQGQQTLKSSQQQQKQEQPPQHSPDPPASPIESALMPAETDWVALASMKAVLKPKLQVLGRDSLQHNQSEHAQHQDGGEQQQPQQQPLFNTLIRNPHSHPVIALAHETRVLLPPHSSFIMGDLTNKRTLAPLIPQEPSTGVCQCMRE